MLRKSAILLCVLLFTIGCSKEFKDNFKKLSPLRDSVMKEFDVKDVRVVIQNGDCIGVSFINSKYNKASKDEQDEVRRRTLQLINSNYPDNTKINSAWVAFVIHENYFFVFNFTDSTNTRFYKKVSDGTWTTR